jgi:lysozyme
MTKQGMDLLISFEGLRLNAYLDSGGTPTIGIGSTYYEDGTKVKMGDTITADEAFRLCNTLVETVYEKWVRTNIKVQNLSDNQMDALTSLCYNIGPGNLQNSTVWRLINSGTASRSEIEVAWRMWNKSKGEILPGLVKRRDAELLHYFHEPEIIKNSNMQENIDREVSVTKSKLAFLSAPRFWALLFLACAQVLSNEGIITPGILEGIQLLLGGFIGVRTLDRSVEIINSK